MWDDMSKIKGIVRSAVYRTLICTHLMQRYLEGYLLKRDQFKEPMHV